MDCLLAWLVSVFGEVGGAACPAGFVSVFGTGGGAGSLVVLCLLGWGGRWCVDCVECLFSVDCFGSCGHISSRALKVASSFSVSWHVLLCGRLLCASAAPNRSRQRPKISSSGVRRERFFFINSHLIPSHLPIACLLVAFCYQATNISISPRSSPRSTRHDGRGGHGCDTADGSGVVAMPCLR